MTTRVKEDRNVYIIIRIFKFLGLSAIKKYSVPFLKVASKWRYRELERHD